MRMRRANKTGRGLVGNNIRLHRRLADLRQSDLAVACGHTGPWLSCLENGVREPTEKEIALLAAALGVAPAALTGRPK